MFASLSMFWPVAPTLAATSSAPSASRGEAYTFAFQNADISQVVQEVLGEAGVPFTMDPSVTGKISFRIEQRLTRDQLIAALEAVLAANNVAMVRNGEMMLIAPQAKAKASAEIRRGAGALTGAGYEIVAVPLGYAQPTEVSRAMEAIADANSVLYANDKLGLLLLGGAGQQLKVALAGARLGDVRRRYSMGRQALSQTIEAARLVSMISIYNVEGVRS